MRISEISRHSGVSVASIKYYTREGLITAGQRTGYNQADYDHEHVARLKLIRALITAGGLSIASTKEVLDAIDDDQMDLSLVFGIAQRASSLIPDEPPSPQAVKRVHELTHTHQWQVSDDNPGVAMVAGALDSFDAIGRDDLGDNADAYVRAADTVAEADVAMATRGESREHSAETLVVGTVLGDTILAGFRRIAHEHYSRQQLAQQVPDACRDTDDPDDANPSSASRNS